MPWASYIYIEVDFNSIPWVADAQINRRDTKFRILGIRLGHQIWTFVTYKTYISLTDW
jgi:hypothetical protein